MTMQSPIDAAQIGGYGSLAGGQSWLHTVRYDCGPHGLHPADSRLPTVVGATHSGWEAAPWAGGCSRVGAGRRRCASWTICCRPGAFGEVFDPVQGGPHRLLGEPGGEGQPDDLERLGEVGASAGGLEAPPPAHH